MLNRSLSLIVMLGLLACSAVKAQDTTGFAALVKQCAPSVDPSTLSAVVRHESGFNPLTISINGPDKLPRQPATVEEAVATAEYLDANGYSFDSGLGQLNNANVRKYKVPWPQVFRVCTNLQTAAAILTECYARASAGQGDGQTALRDALSCYNTGSFDRGHANGYVHKVELAAAGVGPVVRVPAILPQAAGSGAGQATRVASSAAPPAEPDEPNQAPGKPDVFANARGDAFDRAALMAQQAKAIEAIDKAAPAVATPASQSPASDVQ